MKQAMVVLVVLVTMFVACSQSKAQETAGHKLTTDVVYGEGKIEQNGKVVVRELQMDVYEPDENSIVTSRPGVVLVHGGAWHRGGRQFPPYEQFGGVHSMMEDYAKILAPLGYVCFVIEYRLVPDNPVPEIEPNAEGLQRYEQILTDAGIERLTLVRSEMGLSVLTKDDSLILWNGILAGAEDVKMAIDFVRSSSETFGVDPDRIALGGHSAGAGNTLNAAYGLKADVAAIFPMSPAVIGFDMDEVVDSPDLPPMLLLASQNDLGAVLEGIPGLLKTVQKAGAAHDFVWVPGFAHFYPTGAVSLSSDGTRMSVGQRVVKFLDSHLK